MAAPHSTRSGVTYKTIADFPNYMVGDDGSVWTLVDDRWCRIVPRQAEAGYCWITLKSQGETRYVAVHVLVLEAFVGPRPPGLVCCHAPDTDPRNNRIDNLRWDTQKANYADMKKYGMNPIRIPSRRTIRLTIRRKLLSDVFAKLKDS